jgi:DNA-binding transcriptional LysR family regulator
MDMRTFDWSLIRSFLAIVDAGSLMGAARRLGAHQPTLSRHVAELEAQLGVPLFERTGRGVTPTAAALAIVDAARQMESGADGLARSLAAQRSATSGSVRITASEVLATWLLPPLLVQLRLAEPGIQVDLVASNQQSNLLRREADIAVRMVRPEQASLVRRKLGEVPIVAAAHARYLARAGTPRRPEELLQHQLLGADRDETILRGFAAMGYPVRREDFAVRTDNQVTYGQLLVAGAGIGFVAAYCLKRWPDVQPLLPMLRISPLPCWLAVHREIRASRVVRRVYDFLAETLPGELGGPA